MAKHRVVLVVKEENGKWKMQHRIADEEAKKLPPNSGPGDVNDLDDWFSRGWRLVDGSAAPVLQAIVQTGDQPHSNLRALLKTQLSPREPDRLVLVLEHD